MRLELEYFVLLLCDDSGGIKDGMYWAGLLGIFCSLLSLLLTNIHNTENDTWSSTHVAGGQFYVRTSCGVSKSGTFHFPSKEGSSVNHLVCGSACTCSGFALVIS